MIWAERLFVRRYDELVDGLSASGEFEVIKLTAGLRQLLLDQAPLIHQANTGRKIKLRFRVNNVGDSSDLPVRPDIDFHAQGLDPSVIQIPAGTRELKLAQFLGTTVLETPDLKVTVADLIRHGANKAGGVHLDSRREPNEAQLDAAFGRLASVGASPLDISVTTITRITLAALKPLRDLLVQLPASLPLFAHYRLNRGESIRSDGRTQFLETNFAKALVGDFSWNGVIRVMQQVLPGRRILYEIGHSTQSMPRLSVGIDDAGGFRVEAALKENVTLAASVANFARSQLFDRFFYVAADLCTGSDGSCLSVFLNNHLLSKEHNQQAREQFSATRHTIGCRLDGTDCAAVEMREIVLVDRCPSARERAELANYFELQWHY
jgi:hypothetical protein